MTINLQKGLVGHWTMDDRDTQNGIIYDRSAYDNHGMISGTGLTTGTTGKINEAYSFDGSDGHIEMSVQLDVPYTINVWVSPAVNNTMAVLDGTGEADLDFYRHSTQYYYFFTNTENGRAELQTTFNDSIGDWTMVTLLCKDDGREILANGSTESSDDSVSQPVTVTTLGIRENDYQWNGKIDDVWMYNRALSPDEIHSLYHMRNPFRKNIDPTMGPVIL